ncbi:MAG: hypothetical protein HZC14_03445 [Candidatus Niyogibacteria bacterium]|nr:hypothetical protein [Candidatus Niyogibacteria bacterium]
METDPILLPCVTIPLIFLPGQTGQFTAVFQEEDMPVFRLLLDCFQQKKSVVLMVPEGKSATHYYAFSAVAMLQGMSPAQVVAGEKMRFTFRVIGRCQFLGFSTNSENCRLAKVAILSVPDIDDAAWLSDEMRVLRDNILMLLNDVVDAYAALPWEGIGAVAETNDYLREIIESTEALMLRTQLAIVTLRSNSELSYPEYYHAVAVQWMASIKGDHARHVLEANDVKEQLAGILLILDELLFNCAQIDDVFKTMIDAMSSGKPPVNNNLPAMFDKNGQPSKKRVQKDFLADLLEKLDACDKRLIAFLDKIARKEGDDRHE